MLSRTTDLGRRCRCSFWSRMSCDLCLPLTRRQQRQGPVARTPFCVCTANARHNERNKNKQLRNKTHLDCITWPLPQMTPARRWVLGLVPIGRHIVIPQIWHLPSPLTCRLPGMRGRGSCGRVVHRASASGRMPHICNRSSGGQGGQEEARRCMLSRTTDLTWLLRQLKGTLHTCGC